MTRLRWHDLYEEIGEHRQTYTLDAPEGFRTQTWSQIGWIAGDGTVYAFGEIPVTLVSGAYPLWVQTSDEALEGSQEVA